MRGLVGRLFVSIWISMTLSGLAFAVIEATAIPEERVERERNLLRHGVMREAELAAREVEAGGDPSERLHALRDETDAAIFLFTEDGRVYGPGPPSRAAGRLEARVRVEGPTDRKKPSARMLGFMIEGTSIVAIGRLPRAPRWAQVLGVETLTIRMLVVLLVSGIVAWILARYLTRPLERLRRATHKIAAGDLDVRVAPEIAITDEEIRNLARDFDVMAERVQQLLASREELLSDVAHELNSPLARLRLTIELHRDGADEAATASLDRMEREVERLASLVDEILTLSRVDARQIAASPVDLASLVEEVVADADYEAAATGRNVSVDAAPATVSGDAGLLRRAVENIVRNAVRFTEAGTTVEVQLIEVEEAVEVVVRDRGPGVPDEALGRLFEPFFRVDAARDRRTGGAGLGLAIAERAVRLHDGVIRAECPEDGGLRVTIQIPNR